MPRRGFGGGCEVRISVEIYFWDEEIGFFKSLFVFTERLFYIWKKSEGRDYGVSNVGDCRTGRG